MTESGYVEKPILEWLQALGWTFRSSSEMATYQRPEDNPIVEAILLPKIREINSAVKSEEQAKLALNALRKVMSDPDLLSANRNTLEALRDGVSVVLESGKDAVTVQFFAFALDKQDLNDFTITNQYIVRGIKNIRADTVLLVNGIPLVLAEYKSQLSSGKDWKEGVNQIHRYQREAPAVLVSNVFSVSADEFDFRYGPVHFNPLTQQDIDLQRDHWKPWLSQYPTKRGYWNLPKDQQDKDEVRAAVNGLLQPGNVLDFLQHFTVFETKKGKTIKKVARYQQFEGANEIVDRTIHSYKNPHTDKRDRTGLIWHTQGSGKSLTMNYTGNKLRRHPYLESPTVLIVVDRRDLKTQISDDFENCDYPNVIKAMGVRDLKDRLWADRRETIVTTLQCFQQMEDLNPIRRENIIALVDECHRSQKGTAEGHAMTMRVKLPEAFRYGFTGTPIDKTMVNTHRDFGPIKDGKQERYLSYYGIRQAIRDGATLPVFYEYRQIPLAAEEEPLDVGFEQICEEMEVEDEEEKDFVQKHEANWKKLARDPRRVQKVITHMVDHFLKHPDPSGFKAQFVAIDRKACGIYKDALDAELKNRGIGKTEAEGMSEVMISAAQNDTPELTRFHFGKETSDKKIEDFKSTHAQWESKNRDAFGDDRSKWKPELKILIVCDRLLTGFDAPIEQVMYLDKPLRDHNLLQAMARTNRPMSEMQKSHGLIVDYFGVFQDLQKALNFDEKDLEEVATNWEQLRKQVPDDVGRCMKYFEGIKIADTKDCLNACLLRLADERDGKRFKEDFKHLEVLWEALSPDECLYPHRHQYAFLCSMYIAYLRRNRRSPATHEELAVKTRELIQQNTTFLEIAEGVPVYKIDENYLTKVQELPTPGDRAAELEKALTKELIEGGGNNPLYRLLGQRLTTLIENKEAGDAATKKLLIELEAMVGEVNAIKSEPVTLGLTTPGEYPLFVVIREFAKSQDQAVMVEAAKGILEQLVQQKCFPKGWADHEGGRRKVRMALQVASWGYEALELCPLDADGDPPFTIAAAEKLAEVID